MKVLVTGAAGFLGRNLVSELTERGHEVVGFDVVQAPAAGAEFVRGDLGSWPHVLDVISIHRPEVVFHTGALLSALAEADVLGAVMGNAHGTFHVLEASRHFGVRQVMFTSTIATYGRAAGKIVADDSPQFPSSIYGVTKVYGERLGEYYASRFPIEFRAIRFPSIVGPGRGDSGLSAYSSLMVERPARGEPYVVPLDPQTALPIIHIVDSVRALIELSEAGESDLTRRCYLLAGISPTAREIADEVSRQFSGAEISFQPDPASQSIVDSWPREIDEGPAASDWRWKAEFDLPAIVESFRKEIG